MMKVSIEELQAEAGALALELRFTQRHASTLEAKNEELETKLAELTAGKDKK